MKETTKRKGVVSLKKRKSQYCAAVLAILLLVTHANGQKSGDQSGTQDISRTGLLPVYGVDFAFDPAWVDGTQFPSKSAQYQNVGVNASFQQVWETLKLSGFNVIRFPVDVRDAQAAANRVGNLSVWAKANNVKVVVVLTGTDRGKPLGADYSSNVSAFIRILLTALRNNESKLETYPQILAYQLENEMNHRGLHGAMSPEAAQLRLGQAARQLRKSEQEALKDTSLNATPLIVNASFDYVLINEGALAGTTLSDETYARAYGAFKKFLLELAAEPDIDLLGVDWFAGSLSAGTVDRFPALLQSLIKDLPGKQFVFTTGFSTGFHSLEEQKTFYTLSFANLADYRTSQGAESPFIGLVFHEALSVSEANTASPKPDMASEMSKWDWVAKANELARMWNEESRSEVMAWWLSKVESNMALLTLQTDGSGGAAVRPQPAQESLQQIATTVSEANATISTDSVGTPNTTGVAETTSDASASSTDSSPTNQPSAATDASSGNSATSNEVKSKAQQALLLLLDVVINRLTRTGSSNNSEGAAGNTGDSSAGVDPGSSSNSASMPSIVMAKEEVTVAPTSPHKGETVTLNVTVHNQSKDRDATGLVVVLVDSSGNAVSQAPGISITRAGTQNVPLQWTPDAEGTYSLSVQVFDATAATQMANLQLDSLTVAAASDSASTTGAPYVLPPRNKLPFGLPQVRDFTVGAAAERVTVGQMTSVTLSVANPFSRSLMNVKTTLLMDGRVFQVRTLGMLLPQQNRSIVFAGVPFLQPGNHEIKVLLESGEVKRLTGSTSRQIQVGPKIMTPIGPTKPPTVVGPIKPVRPVVAPFNVGGIKVAVGPAGTKSNDASKSSGIRTIGPMKPEGPRVTGAGETGGTRVVGPKPTGVTQTSGEKVTEPPKPGNTKVGPPMIQATDSTRSESKKVIEPARPAGGRGVGSPKTGDSRVVGPPRPENPRGPGNSRSGGTSVTAPAKPSGSGNTSTPAGGRKVVTPVSPGKPNTTNSNSNPKNSRDNANSNTNANINRSSRPSQNQNRPPG